MTKYHDTVYMFGTFCKYERKKTLEERKSGRMEEWNGGRVEERKSGMGEE